MSDLKPRRRPPAAAAIACLALILALGGAVLATAKGQSHKISGNKIKKSSIAGNRLKKDTLTGKQIKESTLGTVPSAALGDSQESERRFNVRLPFGGSQVLFTAGPFTFTATCLQNSTNSFGTPNQDIARIVIATSANGAVFEGTKSKRGTEPTEFLETTTPESERVIEEDSVATGGTDFEAFGSESGAAYSDTGTAVSFGGEGVALGENLGGPGCVFLGNAIVETR